MKNSDQAKKKIADDDLNLSDFAKIMANGIIERESSDPFVISIEGEWGSGKTSLLNFILEKLEAENNFETLHFTPWLISDIDRMLEIFFNDLLKTIKKISIGAESSENLKEVKKNIQKFSRAVLKTNKTLKSFADEYLSDKGQTLYEQK